MKLTVKCLPSRFAPLLFVLLIASIPTCLRATHIVGGEMGYRCLGNNNYEISLTIYRDCFFGNPDAYFDDPASIGVFDSENNLLQDIRVELMGDDTLSPVLTNECLVVPPDVCVHTTTYRTVVELPPRAGGYQLAYQRCCRNQTIANIVNPLATGATYGVEISERALRECNSSAEFLEWPPLYICANEPILFDQSAIDRDGDSIVYRLCAPLQGADQNIPRPQPPNNPPYAEVVWRADYGVDNMLNGLPGGEPLRINSRTGLLTGTPNTIGQFVVGICAEEYRDGELISTSRRDFQYNVGICGAVNAAFFAPEIQCNGLEVNFENRSQDASSFLWYYDYDRDPNAFSTEENPTYTYPDTGSYTVALIAAPGSACADTFIQEIQLLPRTLYPDFALDTVACGDSLVIRMVDRSRAENADIASWEWTLNGEVVSQEPEPLLNLGSGGFYRLGLELTAENGCVRDSISQPLELRPFTVELTQAEWQICPGDSVALYPDADPNLVHVWSPRLFFSDPLAPNPVVAPPDDTLFRVQIIDPWTACRVERTVRVRVSPPLSLALVDTISNCADTFNLIANSPTAIAYQWSALADFGSTLSTAPTLRISPLRPTTYYLAVVDSIGCRFVDSVWVNSQAVNLSPLPDRTLCLGDTLRQRLENLDPGDTLTVNWQPADLLTETSNSVLSTWSFPQAGDYVLSYSVQNQFSCVDIGAFGVSVIDTVNTLADYEYVQCSARNVRFTTTSPHASAVVWDFGDPDSPGARGFGASVQHTYEQAGDYLVRISFGPGLDCADTLLLPITVDEAGPIQTAFDWDYALCTDTLLLDLRATTTGVEITSYTWYLADSLLATGPAFRVGLPGGNSYPISLVTTADNGCRDTIREAVAPRFINFDLADSLVACPGTLTSLYPTADTTFTYEWSPAVGLDDPTKPNPIFTGVESQFYSLTVTDPQSICRREGSIWVEVPPPISYALESPLTTCAPSAELTVRTNVEVQIRWSAATDPDTVLATSSTWQAPVAGPTTYYLSLTDAVGCQVRDSISVDGQGIMLSLHAPELLCRGDSIRLLAENSGFYPITDYEWAPSEYILSGGATATPLVAPPTDIAYTLRVRNEQGCELDTAVLVRVSRSAVPTVAVVPPIDTILPGETVQLSATFRSDLTYNWTPAGGLDAVDVFDPRASPGSTTRYLLTVTDRDGCTATDTSLIVVLNSPCVTPYIFVPSAFSPNGDQLNDELRVAGNVIDEFYLVIYNRWGEEVFSTRDQRVGWDGTFRGTLLPADVYGYYLEVRCFDGMRFLDKGNITLLP